MSDGLYMYLRQMFVQFSESSFSTHAMNGQSSASSMTILILMPIDPDLDACAGAGPRGYPDAS